jgi:hypothetical protein
MSSRMPPVPPANRNHKGPDSPNEADVRDSAQDAENRAVKQTE